MCSTFVLNTVSSLQKVGSVITFVKEALILQRVSEKSPGRIYIREKTDTRMSMLLSLYYVSKSLEPLLMKK